MNSCLQHMNIVRLHIYTAKCFYYLATDPGFNTKHTHTNTHTRAHYIDTNGHRHTNATQMLHRQTHTTKTHTCYTDTHATLTQQTNTCYKHATQTHMLHRHIRYTDTHTCTCVRKHRQTYIPNLFILGPFLPTPAQR